MLIFLKTHQGLVRPSNQDTLLVMSCVYGVADGMGGHKGGETASRVAVQVLEMALRGKIPGELALKEGIEAANRRVFDMGRRDKTLSGMGTTVTLLWEGMDCIWIAHVGDSRAYLLRDGELKQQTEDHNVVAELVRDKLITPEMAAIHPYRNVITRAVGIDSIVTVDIQTKEKNKGDIWLVCSDGLYNMVPDKQIQETILELSLEMAAEKLLQLAIEHGGRDNISFVLGAITEANNA